MMMMEKQARRPFAEVRNWCGGDDGLRNMKKGTDRHRGCNKNKRADDEIDDSG